MLYWDLTWKEHKESLETLTGRQLAQLALACIDDLYSEYNLYFEKALEKSQQHLIASTLSALRSNASVGPNLERLDEQLDKPLATGVWDLFMALSQLVQTFDGATSEDALEVMSYAYQSVLAIEVLSKLETETLEDEIRRLEAASPACVRAINSQLSQLSMLIGPFP